MQGAGEVRGEGTEGGEEQEVGGHAYAGHGEGQQIHLI